MIVVDIETSGLDSNIHGIWQIGALDLENPENQFIEEGKINFNDLVNEGALNVTGKSEQELRDNSKNSERELLENFFKWCETVKIKNCICQNPQFDLGFLITKAKKYGLKIPILYRAFDLHSIAAIRYFQINNEFLMFDNKSDMGLGNILEFCGLKEVRVVMDGLNVSKEGKPHNALEDTKLTAECFSRIVYGGNLLQEFKEFKLPDYLKNDKL